MIIELHVLQNFVPANLNRDDTGSPKDCLFGGYTRARISSQCFKRAMRTEFRQAALMPDALLAQRTLKAQEALAKLLERLGRDRDAGKATARVALSEIAIKPSKKNPEQTEYLLFLAPQELERVAQIIHQHWDDFQPILEAEAAEAAAPNGGCGRGRVNNPPTVPPAVKNKLKGALDGNRAADLALFGRMIADLPGNNVEAACQVAHALSTHPVETEFDFYTAVDDLQRDDATGAGMLGVVEFNSACFYRYANVDTTQLLRNLGGDAALMAETVKGFLHAMVHAVPTGKQNSMAAHNPPSLVLAVVRERGQWNLANAFVQPVRPKPDADLMTGSIAALDVYWNKLVGMYGTEGLRGQWVATMESEALRALRPAQVPSFAALAQAVVAQTREERQWS